MKDQKKTLDNSITTIKKDLLTRIAKLEAEAETRKKKKASMQEKISALREEVASL